MPAFRRHANPFQLTLEGFLPLALCFFFLLQAIALLVEPGRVIPFPWNSMPSIQFQNPSSNVVQKIPVVRYSDNGSFVPLNVMFEPGNGFRVEMIRWLI